MLTAIYPNALEIPAGGLRSPPLLTFPAAVYIIYGSMRAGGGRPAPAKSEEGFSMTYTMKVAGLERQLPLCKVADNFYIGAFIIFGDAELTVACARDLLARRGQEHSPDP